MKASELRELLEKVPPAAEVKASYDCGCAWGPVIAGRIVTVMGTGEVEIELEVE